jgi:hypothetical protein
MSAENKPSFGTRVAEISQKFDIVTSIAAVGGSMLGIIPIGFTFTLLEFNALTYLGAEALKEKK